MENPPQDRGSYQGFEDKERAVKTHSPVIVIVIVIVDVGGPVIVAAHVHGNAPVTVIEGQKVAQGAKR